MAKIRVLLVDDAAVVRRLVTTALNRDPDLEVVGTAADGRIALERLDKLQPDLVLLDLEMPVMSGLETLAVLRKTHPRLPVIMFSRFTQKGVEATVHALTLGADDYVPKPGDGLDVSCCIEELLIPKIKLLAKRSISPKCQRENFPVASASGLCAASPTPVQPVPKGTRHRPVQIVVIGTSTGGPNALAELLPVFPADWNVPLVVVQHMPPDFTARLAERLNAKSRLRVREAAAGEPISAAQAWVARGDHHLLVQQEGNVVCLGLHQGPPVNGCRPAVDVFFHSAAEVYGSGVLAVVLTGMGQDGLRGCERVRAAGGQILVQDEASSVVWSMPGAVAQAGLADRVLPLQDLGQEIIRRVRASIVKKESKAEHKCP
ncbi:MAG TPA: chemotaxis response regulator protein-glutamate methylesterase [Gemmataceae bacterium]|nr:chemotaxis response regulator protein-glutamate methylesterase [Gemmataceae bacterium]